MNLFIVKSLPVMQGSRGERAQGRKEYPSAPVPLHRCRETTL